MEKEFSLIPNENLSEESELVSKQSGLFHKVALTDRRIFYHIKESPGKLLYLLAILLPVPFLFLYYSRLKKRNVNGFLDLLDVESIKQRRRPLKRVFSLWVLLVLLFGGLYVVSLWTDWLQAVPLLSYLQDFLKDRIPTQPLYQWLGLAVVIWIITFLVSLPLIFSSKWMLEIATPHGIVEIDAGGIEKEKIDNFIWQVFLFKESLRKKAGEPVQG